MNRREFAEALALAALAPLSNPAWPAGLPLEGAVGFADEPGPLARALSRAIRVQYGSRLSEQDLATITRQIQTSLDRAEQVRKVELANGDGPDFIFRAGSQGPIG